MQHTEGAQLAAQGIATAIAHADRLSPDWSQRAYAMAREFLRTRTPLDRFQIEDVRDFATGRGLEEPPSLRAWGGITRRLKNESLLRAVGFAPVKNPRAHAAPTAVYEVTPEAWR